jgi:hypothetical protein
VNKRNMEKWIAALRSGKYKQIHDRLRGDEKNCFCAIGVACEISKLYKWADGVNIPHQILEWLGIPGESHFIEKIADFNDHHRLTFDQIADKIERAIK